MARSQLAHDRYFLDKVASKILAFLRMASQRVLVATTRTIWMRRLLDNPAQLLPKKERKPVKGAGAEEAMSYF